MLELDRAVGRGLGRALRLQARQARGPGASTLARIPYLACSAASARVNAVTQPFVAE
jgi:hypothetical protein